MASNLDPIETSGAHQMNEILGRLNKLKSNERVVSGDTQEYDQEKRMDNIRVGGMREERTMDRAENALNPRKKA
jgi:cytochrome c-type biogenesis protein CcmE